MHSSLFEIPLLGDEPIQPVQQRIHIAQHRRDGTLFVVWRYSQGVAADLRSGQLRNAGALNRKPYATVNRNFTPKKTIQ